MEDLLFVRTLHFCLVNVSCCLLTDTVFLRTRIYLSNIMITTINIRRLVDLETVN